MEDQTSVYQICIVTLCRIFFHGPIEFKMTLAWLYIVIGACRLWMSQNKMYRYWVCPITDHVLDTTGYFHKHMCILSFDSKCHLALAAVCQIVFTNFWRPFTIQLLFCNGFMLLFIGSFYTFHEEISSFFVKIVKKVWDN